MRLNWRVWVALAAPAVVAAQAGPEMRDILQRLERLEAENRRLGDEVKELRSALERRAADGADPGPAVPREQPAVEERVTVVERRVEELAQAKVETAHKVPVALTGMVLFNAFWNGRYGGDQQYPITAQSAAGRGGAGGSLRQSVIGLRLDGPAVWGGGRVSGAITTDLFAGSAQSLNHLLRLRVATVRLDWKNTAIVAGQDKPIISPREPTSLAQVGYSPLTAAGNLWLWQPQARIEQRVPFGEDVGLRAQVGVFETSESGSSTPAEYAAALSRGRPGLQGRFELWKRLGENARLEIAPGFHRSTTHLMGASIPSRLFSVDWLVQPAAWADFSGMYFRGENVAVLGSTRQGFVVADGIPRAVHSNGGWGQLSVRPAARVSVNLFTGQQDDRNANLQRGNVAKNLAFGGNVMYRLGPNVLAAVEAARIRTTYLGSAARAVNHYDVALAYLF